MQRQKWCATEGHEGIFEKKTPMVFGQLVAGGGVLHLFNMRGILAVLAFTKQKAQENLYQYTSVLIKETVILSALDGHNKHKQGNSMTCNHE